MFLLCFALSAPCRATTGPNAQHADPIVFAPVALAGCPWSGRPAGSGDEAAFMLGDAVASSAKPRSAS
jgi:hypothetical protein